MKKVREIRKEHLSEDIGLLLEDLQQMKLRKSTAMKSVMSAEDLLYKLFENGNDDVIRVNITARFGSIRMHMTSKGEKFSVEDVYQDYSCEGDEEFNSVVRGMMHKLTDETVTVKNANGQNICDILVAAPKNKKILMTLIALVAGALFGFLLKSCLPANVTNAISQRVFSNVSSMFMSALKMIVGPVVFLSIATSIADFTDLKALGRLAGKVMAWFLLTSAGAIFVGFFNFRLFPVGDPSLAAAVTAAPLDGSAASAGTLDSILNLITGIIPGNIVSPFLNNDMLQILFMGVLLGLSVGKLTGKYPKIREVMNCVNDIVGQIASIIIGFLPVAIFCSMAAMVISVEAENLLKVIAYVPVCYSGCVIVFCLQCLLLLIVGRLNPIKFIRGFSPAMITAASLCSSSATLPTSMKCCEERLGIAKQLYSFSVPLGATVNMNGACVMCITTICFLAKVFGMEITANMLIMLTVSILALCVGAPGLPGGSLVGLALILPQINIPAEALGLILGVYSLTDMVGTCVNVTGDSIVTAIVASNEGLLNKDVYNAN